jgi:hypothetical protein
VRLLRRWLDGRLGSDGLALRCFALRRTGLGSRDNGEMWRVEGERGLRVR